MGQYRPIIAICGLACETSTFSPAKTLAAAFHPLRASAVITKYGFIAPGTPLGEAAQWKGALIGHALPGGIVTAAAFEELAAEIVERLRGIVEEGRVDGLWFDIHGAMCVEGMDDVEAELLRRVRGVVGRDVMVAASMDLHGNVSRELAHQTDLITCFRMVGRVLCFYSFSHDAMICLWFLKKGGMRVVAGAHTLSFFPAKLTANLEME